MFQRCRTRCEMDHLPSTNLPFGHQGACHERVARAACRREGENIAFEVISITREVSFVCCPFLYCSTCPLDMHPFLSFCGYASSFSLSTTFSDLPRRAEYLSSEVLRLDSSGAQRGIHEPSPS